MSRAVRGSLDRAQTFRDWRRIVNPALNGRQMHAIHTRTHTVMSGQRCGTMAAYISTESSSFSPVLNGCCAPRLHAVLVLQRAD